MPRKAFVADLQNAIKHFAKANVVDLRSGEEDGMINFDYCMPNGDSTQITILVPDLGEYPDAHLYMVYTNSQHVAKPIHQALDEMGNFIGTKVLQMLTGVVKSLDKATAGSQGNPVDLDDDDDPMVVDSDNASDADENFDPNFDSDDDSWSPKNQKSAGGIAARSAITYDSATLAFNDRIRHDLRLAKEAGFRIACLGSLLDGGKGGIICLSLRINRLGISSEALQAWHIDPSQYFVLLIRYNDGYFSLDKILGADINSTILSVQFRVGLCAKYKPGIQEAIDAFSEVEDRSRRKRENVPTSGRFTAGLDRLFIGRPLNYLLNHRLLLLLRYRSAMHFSWRGAEEFFNDHQGRNVEHNDVDPKYWAQDPADHSETLPHFVTSDHMTGDTKKKSFPLLAVQFALRHLARCTEFCLVCHCKIDADFEALKPYVCSKPLCLWQYMSLGFGPSLEDEIISQPHVVDLLISFCYSSAFAKKLRYLPTGMALSVPGSFPILTSELVPSTTSKQFNMPGTSQNLKMEYAATTQKAKFDPLAKDIIFGPGQKPPLQIGSWICYGPSHNERYHARVKEVLLPTVRLSTPIPSMTNTISLLHGGIPMVQKTSRTTGSVLTPTSLTTPPTSSTNLSSMYHEIDFTVYEQNFDDLSDFEKQMSICTLLDTLPSVKEMKDFLLQNDRQQTVLSSWNDRISPAALGILRWIVASNRSCILQVDSLDDSTQNPEDRVHGMPGWMQFRFAQGAPDKEQRFITSVRQKASTTKVPTLFAWHGSPLHNWHGIVREGLHFEQIGHGRAYGHGVYHALDVSTSLTYSGSFRTSAPSFMSYAPGDDGKAVDRGQWPLSQLRISQALVLNEIVNAPEQFVSRSPHLVVSQLDWIQSRYLFVSCSLKGHKKAFSESSPIQELAQDPTYKPLGQDRTPLSIPITAVSKSRRPSASQSVKTGNKKQRIGELDSPPEEIVVSDDTDMEDNLVLFPTEEEELARKATQLSAVSSRGKECQQDASATTSPKTDFVPGSHDLGSLPLIDPPTYATSSATRTLQRELQATLKIQDNTPIDELGWYIDRELVTNVYQWILELHSFESTLPLAHDMKSKSLKSIVLEIRFGKDYPMSPPFVRVIRPRFLGFNEGGGGHVTAGGALCMELLTNSGWSAVSNIESVLLQVRMAISSTDPRPARLAWGAVRDYAVGEAIDAYIRACNMHGWQIPPDFRTSYSQGSASSSKY